MRVADFLQDLGEMGRKNRRRKRINFGAPPLHCEPQTPRSFLFRWLFNTTPAAGDVNGGAAEGSKSSCLVPFSKSCCKNEEEDEKEDEEGFGPDEAKETIPAIGESTEGEKKPEVLSFNLGMGAGLVFLLAKSASEFNKMVELRSEMEMMIKYIKGEMQRKASVSNLPESKVHSFPNSYYLGSECSNKPQYLPDDTESCNFTGAYGAMVTHRQSNLNMDLDTKMRSRGNEMEQELQVELQRLQLNLEDQDSSMHPHQDRLEVDSESNESFNDTYQQVNEPNKSENNKQTGVCPRELERRLHELLEARQHERIVELENALECAERKLNEKDMEICWWRDTARLVSKHREERLQLQF
ncbi:hypothetical protein KFK09_011896 [Dendrobium nobile]|uniref:Protein POLAR LOCALIZATION DURING ASYMMETRIC DIVISION AND REDISTRIBUTION n=1 Tax=Dendrobium nobile TaxID=94219 RepID=A0A8T3BH70_DENNO|nr:hypothetical protein KFK09_011896 [Dendrobium nobile]